MSLLAVQDQLHLSTAVLIGAAAILAETSDPRRFATGRAVVKHAGLAPREKVSGAFTGRTRLTGQGQPGLRLAAWRAVWGAAVTPTARATAGLNHINDAMPPHPPGRQPGSCRQSSPGSFRWRRHD